MSSIGRKTVSARKRHAPSADKPSSGKENEPPSLRGSVQKSADLRTKGKTTVLPRKRAPLGTAVRPADRVTVDGPTTASIPAPRRTSFNVHRDKSEENLRGKNPPPAKSVRGGGLRASSTSGAHLEEVSRARRADAALRERAEDLRGRFQVPRGTKIPVRVDSAARGLATGAATATGTSQARSVSTSRLAAERSREHREVRTNARSSSAQPTRSTRTSTARVFSVGRSSSSASSTSAGRSLSSRLAESKAGPRTRATAKGDGTLSQKGTKPGATKLPNLASSTRIGRTVARESTTTRRLGSWVERKSENREAGGDGDPVSFKSRSSEPSSSEFVEDEARKEGRNEMINETRNETRNDTTDDATRIDARNRAGIQARNEDVAAARLGSVITPIDGPPPPLALLPVKAMVRQAKQQCVPKREKRHRVETDEAAERFPPELIYHAEYHDYLPIAEKERDERSPRLSSSFLREHINAEQRRLIVVFLIHSATHCRYPSYVLYQAVKLFDAAVDRVPVETAYMQLTGLAALWIALKGQENFHRIPSATKMVALAKDMYLGREDLLMKYERKILLALNFNVTCADAFSLFTYHLINCRRRLPIADDAVSFVYNCGGCLIDLSLLDEKFCRVSPRLVAAAAAELALVLALDLDEQSARPQWQFWRRLVFGDSPESCRFPDEKIDALRVALIRRALGSGKRHTDFDVLYKKYSRSRYGRIADHFLERVKRISYAEIFDPA